jgi:hypothetical protein
MWHVCSRQELWSQQRTDTTHQPGKQHMAKCFLRGPPDATIASLFGSIVSIWILPEGLSREITGYASEIDLRSWKKGNPVPGGITGPPFS